MRILISGIGGHMGQHVLQLALKDPKNFSVSCGVDAMNAVGEVPCFSTFSEVNTPVDMVIDFSHHSLTGAVISYCLSRSVPVVLCTTGHTEDEKAVIRSAAEHIPVFFSANMSLGVALLCDLACKAATEMPDADIEIIETHHNRKLDAPSGTAIMLAEAIGRVREKVSYVMGRHGQTGRTKEEIGIHAVRRGNIVGTHEVILSTADETLTLKHEAHDRAMFASGALAAARFLYGKKAGLYTMQDMIR